MITREQLIETAEKHGCDDPDSVQYYLDYHGLLTASGLEVVEWEVTGSYQGDYVVLVRDNARYGFVVIGYGSCTGCDALEGCGGIDDVLTLCEQILQSIKWADSAEELRDHLIERADTGNDWYSHDSEVREATEKIKRRLALIRIGEISGEVGL